MVTHGDLICTNHAVFAFHLRSIFVFMFHLRSMYVPFMKKQYVKSTKHPQRGGREAAAPLGARPKAAPLFSLFSIMFLHKWNINGTQMKHKYKNGT